ncbi:hypothetical protein [Streptomyces atrovirens]|uniref:Uncharacterized protein n=1 Tax=Streptomyces atrovirens TaxID=285556 RepID=A0ABW0DUU4_9ACTN
MGAARWIDARDATADLRLLSRDGGALDLMPGKPKVLARWSSDREPTEQ